MIRHKNKAFTLIELLVVVAIIAALVGILSVAQRKVKVVSKNLQQKAAFHAMEVGLELFSKEFGDYPDSDQVSEGTVVTGAQRLAEAMLGRDELGFHPRSKWHPAKEADEGLTLYDISVDDTTKQRKPEYFEMKRSGFYRIDELWATYPGIEPTPVITDVFLQNKDTVIGEKTGMPVLYFKADPSAPFRTMTTVTNSDQGEYDSWAYSFLDNYPILQLSWLRDTSKNGLDKHFQEDPDNPVAGTNAQVFYEMVTQSERDTNNDGTNDFFKPNNQRNFILISAGYDGIYGTKDDLTNFDK